ncbi:hypothetical protein M409DRAFT_66300 [Zasmidium cellare ATCC 36951]|uniref:ASST-domain-containing protein n=1 Tax=Zasmidium cellare ATCC 36951 TaxID=1080233 RepID=A0A6A6CL11_ZASCE|nr:uncharacterized protein M409DRAFT_66300 [Zasmidium cellare ATCC 36951]KAF2167303.1 hypothetical protein M409DRAFT_66300 [Zasmidium cellare ATCC 36951]
MEGKLSFVWLYLAFLCSFFLSIEAVASPPPSRRPSGGPWKEQPAGEGLIQDADYDRGAYGRYVTQTFRSASLTVPRLNMDMPFTNCNDGSYLFVTPRGEVVKEPLAAIYDATGSLIWTPTDHSGEVYNFEVQQYKGDSVLTFWGGDNGHGHGSGHYFMYDKHYNLIGKVNAVGGYGADLHSFTILPNDHALVTIYDKVGTDLAEVLGRPHPGKWMWDSMFQEINLETNELVFEWRASHHFAFSESYISTLPATESEPWDWFHINTVEKDEAGNYLISARHLRCVAYISRETGEVLWRLGGKRNSFNDLSNGQATHFVGQHDTHWDQGHRYITMFDNRADWQDEQEHVSKGKRIEIDLENMTAKLDTTFVHPKNIFAFSQGSYQTLPHGNVVLGYGYTGAMAEFSSNGTLLCDAYLQPSSRFSSGDVQSYRNLKFNWTGLPTTKPSMVLDNGTIYVSWLGSTEVRSWMLEDAVIPEGRLGPVTTFAKSGFETVFTIPEDLPLRQYIRIVALNKDSQDLSASDFIDVGDKATVFTEPPFEPDDDLNLEEQLQDLGALLGRSTVGSIPALESTALQTPGFGIIRSIASRGTLMIESLPSISSHFQTPVDKRQYNLDVDAHLPDPILSLGVLRSYDQNQT